MNDRLKRIFSQDNLNRYSKELIIAALYIGCLIMSHVYAPWIEIVTANEKALDIINDPNSFFIFDTVFYGIAECLDLFIISGCSGVEGVVLPIYITALVVLALKDMLREYIGNQFLGMDDSGTFGKKLGNTIKDTLLDNAMIYICTVIVWWIVKNIVSIDSVITEKLMSNVWLFIAVLLIAGLLFFIPSILIMPSCLKFLLYSICVFISEYVVKAVTERFSAEVFGGIIGFVAATVMILLTNWGVNKFIGKYSTIEGVKQAFEKYKDNISSEPSLFGKLHNHFLNSALLFLIDGIMILAAICFALHDIPFLHRN